MPLDSIADLERRIRRLEMELDQNKHKFVAPDRTVNTEPPLAHIDHGALAGLADNDHPQYLLTTGKAADSDKLDGLDSTAFLLTTGKAADSDKLDGYDTTGYVNTMFNQTVGGTKTFSSIPVLPASNPTLENQAVRKGYSDATYLGISAKAADSDKLDGVDSTGYATASHNHTGVYLPIAGKAADSDKLDGYDSAVFGRPVFLAAPKTSTSWDGDARSTTSSTKIDTSAVFGIPDGVKALIVRVYVRDSATFPNTSIYFQIGPAASANNQIRLYPVGGDIMATVTGICNCDANGDIYYGLAASGTGTMDCWIEIWGWWL